MLQRLLLIFLLCPSPLLAEGLSPAQCAQIEATYGVEPAVCVGSPGITAQQRQDHIFFPDGGALLDARALDQIRLLARALQGQVLGQACLQLIGHSDTSGGVAGNLAIGKKRAEAVRDALAPMLANPARIELIQSKGEETPLASIPGNDPWQRRVEIRARTCPQFVSP
jgi:OOP family OmpA-OmpF porin